jgi:hypothetical protein
VNPLLPFAAPEASYPFLSGHLRLLRFRTAIGRKMITSPTASIGTFANVVLIAAIGSTVTAGALATDPAATQRVKIEQQRKMAEYKREIKQGNDRLRQRMPNGTANVRGSSPLKPKTPEFNPSSASPPDECLKRFISTARNATSMEQILPYLPQDEQTVIKNRQSTFDPKDATRGREWFRKQNPNLTDEQLDHLSRSPYVNELKFHKSLANDIRDILSVKVDGAKATLVVSTSNGATINGEYYPYGKADVEMVGEGNAWKLSRFRPSIVYYKEPPKTPH